MKTRRERVAAWRGRNRVEALRRIGLGALGAAGAMASVRLASHVLEAALLGAVAFVASIYGLLGAALLWDDVPGRHVLVDRRLAPGDSTPDGAALYLFAPELDALATSLGARPLSTWVAPRLEADIARHDPVEALATVDALLASDALPPEAADAVRDLRSRLEAAAAAAARFCLRDGQGWSGAIEMNLRIYWA